MKILYTTLLPFLIFSTNLHSQESSDSLENLLSSEVPQEINYTSATFKSTRIMNGHSVERMPQGQLDVRIHHRFLAINNGAYGFWGLDGANTFVSMEYGIKNWVMVGIGHTNLEKTYHGFVKFSLFRQSTGKRDMPFSISWFSSVAYRSEKFPDINAFQKNSNYSFTSRLSYVNQLLVARKFNEIFSLQLSPTVVHFNLVTTELDLHDVYALGLGGRIKLSKRISFNAEYFYAYRPTNSNLTQNYKNPLSIGFDIETGGHVFQLLLTNANNGMIEKQFIGQTTDTWNKAGIHIGFNISRVFDINHHK